MTRRMRTRTYITALAALLILAACSGGSSDSVGPAGLVSNEQDVVEHGSSESALSQLFGSKDLFSGDFLQVHDGGVGRLDFGDAMLLRVLNDTKLSEIRSEAVAGSPIDVQMFLEDGGFTGRLTEDGGRALFTTPGGAQISVLGTEFFVIYDAGRSLTVAGNFDGSVKITSGGSSEFVNPGFYVKAPSGSPPGPQEPLPLTLSEYEDSAIALSSPIIAFDIIDQGCIDDSEFVQDVTVPAGAAIGQGVSFTKSWQVRNSGSCSWSAGYQLELVGGDAMTDDRQIPISESVEPGELYTLSVDMVAPGDPGRYEGQWQLSNAEGERFGEQLVAEITVIDTTEVFAAETRTEDGNTVPKSTFAQGDSIEFVIVVENNTGGSAEVELTYELSDPSGQVVELWSGTVTSSEGRRPWRLSETVPPDTAGTYTFTGFASYGGAVTQATAEYQVIGPSPTPTVTPSLTPTREGTCIYSLAVTDVIRDASVAFQVINFPANQTFTVTQGPVGTYGINGVVVGQFNSGSGGSFFVTMPIAVQFAGSDQIAIRAESSQGAPICADTEFDNVSTPTVTPTPTDTLTPPTFPPDLISFIERTGPPAVGAGSNIVVPVRVTVRNQGGQPAGVFKVSTEYTGPNGTFLRPFTVPGVPGQNSFWYPFTNSSLAPGNSVAFNGTVTFLSSSEGQTVSLRAFADSCAGEEFVPSYCRVEERNENNNVSNSITVQLPDIATPTPRPLLISSFSVTQLQNFDNRVSWQSSGGRAPFSGTITARYMHENTPYKTYDISRASGSLDDDPPVRCEGTFDVVYTIILRDDSGQERSASDTEEVLFIC